MLNPNIQDVSFSFDTHPDMEKILNDTGAHIPHYLAQELTKHFSLDLPETRDRHIHLHIDFETRPFDEICFAAFEYTHGVKHNPFNEGAKTLTIFTVSLAEMVGEDWQNPDLSVAEKLQAVLSGNGLKHIYSDRLNQLAGLNPVYVEHELLGIASDHAKMRREPAIIAQRLEML